MLSFRSILVITGTATLISAFHFHEPILFVPYIIHMIWAVCID